MARLLRIGVPAAVALAALSLALPYQPVYDPWGWLVWGRELAALDLATAERMSWKPLPVFVDALLSPLGDLAPKGWLLVARTGWLLAPLLAAWLALRLVGEEVGRWRYVAAVLAAASVASTADSFTPLARQFSGGLSDPLLVALVLAAFAAGLERRSRLALWLGFGAALLRPETWPFLAVWGVWQGRRDPRLRPQLYLVALAIPLAWFVPDLLGAGDPLAGSRTARGGPVEPFDALTVFGRALAAPLVAAWAGFVLFFRVRDPEREADRVLGVLAVGALAWIGLVAAMSVFGYAGLPRFLAPATAAVAVVGAVGVARAGAHGFGSVPGHVAAATRPLAAAAALAIVLAVAGFGLRAAEVPADLRDVDRQSSLVEGIFDLAEQVPAERLLSCGRHARLANLLTPPTALAWKLERPLASVRTIQHPEYGVAISTRPLPRGKLIERAGRWRATQLGC